MREVRSRNNRVKDGEKNKEGEEANEAIRKCGLWKEVGKRKRREERGERREQRAESREQRGKNVPMSKKRVDRSEREVTGKKAEAGSRLAGKLRSAFP